ncbi:MAG: ABC transporter permease [Vicinamibacterales bacterium]
MDVLLTDVRFALRTLRRNPAFALLTVLTLALGIGANTAIFSVVNGVLLRPLDYPKSDRLVFITTQFPTLGFDQFWMSLPEYAEFREHNQAFASVGGYSVGAINLDTDPPSRPVQAVVTPDLMPTLGVAPLHGRWFEEQDSRPGAPPVTILSWELWQRAYGGESSVVGRQIMLNNISTQVVGVMPRGYDVHEQRVEIWQPLTIDPATFPTRRGGHFLYLIGRLKDDVSFDQAKADTERLVAQWRQIVPQGHVPGSPNHQLRLDPLKDDIIGAVKTPLLILQAAVVFVLLIACANLANLLLARAETRQREFAVRTAMGAGRRRLLRQFITEGVMLSLLASAVGVGLAWLGLRAMLAINPDAIPRTSAITLDGPVLLFTLAVAIGTGVVFGLAPLLHLTQRLTIALRDGGRGTTTGALRKSLRGALVVSEVTLAVVLVIGASLLVRSFVNLLQVDAGFNRSHLSTFGVVLPGGSYSPERRVQFYSDLQTRLGALPGVTGVTSMTGLPPNRAVNANDTDFEHITPPPPGTDPTTPGLPPPENVDYYQTVTLGYTDTMGIPIVDGRAFESADVGGAPVALVNETLARRFFTDRNPVGQRLKPGFNPAIPWFTIVGVVKDVRQGGVDQPAGTELYLLAEQGPRIAQSAPTNMNLVVRSERPLDALAPEIRRIVRDLDATLPVIRLQTMDEVFDRSVARPKFITWLLGVFAALALVLAAIGTYGILSYLVTERQQEIGIRMALGAPRGQVLWMVLRQGLLLAGLGLALGIAGALAAGQQLEHLLFGVSPTDTTTFVVVALLILATATLACLVPALRATRIDPMVALRE